MHAERNHLITVVFPQLRKLCESRGVIWGEVDLRWGVPDEAAAEGKVLPICLEEIRRCRPYFIGLLGERYGWVPQSIPEELLESEPWLKKQFRGRKSITELEILHGVLRNQDMAEHAFFYFRDPDWLDRLPPDAVREDFISEDVDSAKKLIKLKNCIRASGMQVRENYPSPEALGSLVLEDLTAVINQLYPNGSQPDPLTRDAIDHEAYARNLEQVYIGRQEYFDRLDAHAAGDDQPLVIIGESGSGKSALLANWISAYRKFHPDTFVLEHYIGAASNSSDWKSMLFRIIGGFKRGLNIQQNTPDELAHIPGMAWVSHPESGGKLIETPVPYANDNLRSAFANWLHMAAAKGRVILVIDALNQLEDEDGAPDLIWLPPKVPANVRLILSARPSRALNALKKRGWTSLAIQPLDVNERKQLIQDFLQQYSKKLSFERIERIATCSQAANPLYLRALLGELRVFGIFERLDERIEHYLQAKSIQQLYDKILARYEHDYNSNGSKLVQNSMTLIWASRYGLSEIELLELLGNNRNPLPHAQWSPFYLASERLLINRKGLIGFYHDDFCKTIENRYLANAEAQVVTHLRLANYFATSKFERKLEEYPWQLLKGKNWESLFTILQETSFIDALLKTNSIDVQTYWSGIESNSHFKIIDAYWKIIDNPHEHEKIAGGIVSLITNAGYFDQTVSMLNKLSSYYRQCGDREHLLRTQLDIAGTLANAGDYSQAMEIYKEQEKICRNLGNTDALSYVLSGQTRIFQYRGELKKAAPLCEELERIYRETNNQEGMVSCLLIKTDILRQQGQPQVAMTILDKAKRICHTHNFQERSLEIMEIEAILLAMLNNINDSLETFRKVESIAREQGNRMRLASVLNNRDYLLHKEGYDYKLFAAENNARVACAQGAWEKAVTELTKVEEEYRKLGFMFALQHCLGNHANILKDQSNLQGALEIHREEEQICRELNKKKELAVCLGNQAVILREVGELDSAMQMHQEEQRLYEKLNDKEGLQVSFGNQVGVLKSQGNVDKALMLARQAEELARELGNFHAIIVALFNQAGLLSDEMGRHEEAMILAEKAMQQAMKENITELVEQLRPYVKRIKDRASQNTVALASGMSNIANVLKAKDDLDEALNVLIKQEQIYRLTAQKFELQQCLSHQSRILHEANNFKKALAVEQENEQLCRELGKNNELSISLGHQANMLRKIGNFDRALILHQEEEKLCRSAKDKKGLGICLGNKALIFQAKGSVEQALQLHLQAEQIFRDLRLYEELSKEIGAQAFIHLSRGETDQAMLRLNEMERICRDTNNLLGLHASLGMQCNILHKLGQNDKAFDKLHEVEVLCRRLGNKFDLVTSMEEQAVLLAETGSYEKALQLLKELREICKEIENFERLAVSLINEALILAKIGKSYKAVKLAEESIQVADEHGLTNLSQKLRVTLQSLRSSEIA